MGNSNSSNITDNNNIVINGMIGASESLCSVDCDPDSISTTITVSTNNGSVEIEQICGFTSIDCVMNESLSANNYNILQSAADESEWSSPNGDTSNWFMTGFQWSDISDTVDINQYIQNSTYQLMNSAAPNINNSSLDSLYYVNKGNGNYTLTQSNSLTLSSAQFANAARQVTAMASLTKQKQSSSSHNPISLLLTVIIIIVIIGVLILIVMVTNRKKVKQRKIKEYNPSNDVIDDYTVKSKKSSVNFESIKIKSSPPSPPPSPYYTEQVEDNNSFNQDNDMNDQNNNQLSFTDGLDTFNNAMGTVNNVQQIQSMVQPSGYNHMDNEMSHLNERPPPPGYYQGPPLPGYYQGPPPPGYYQGQPPPPGNNQGQPQMMPPQMMPPQAFTGAAEAVGTSAVEEAGVSAAASGLSIGAVEAGAAAVAETGLEAAVLLAPVGL